MGGYELIFPSADKERNKQYDEMLAKSNEIFDDFTTGKNRRRQQLLEAQKQTPQKPAA